MPAMPVGGGVGFSPDVMPPMPTPPQPMPIPQMPVGMTPMKEVMIDPMRPRFAKGEEVTPGKGMIGTKAGLGSGKFRLPNPGQLTAAARSAAMSPIARFGIPGAIAAGGIALYQIADEMGYIPEMGEVDPVAIGRGAASADKAFLEVVNEARDMARDIGAPV